MESDSRTLSLLVTGRHEPGHRQRPPLQSRSAPRPPKTAAGHLKTGPAIHSFPQDSWKTRGTLSGGDNKVNSIPRLRAGRGRARCPLAARSPGQTRSQHGVRRWESGARPCPGLTPSKNGPTIDIYRLSSSGRTPESIANSSEPQNLFMAKRADHPTEWTRFISLTSINSPSSMEHQDTRLL